MTKTSWVFFTFLSCFQLFAQSKDSLHINFKVNFDKFPLELNKEYTTSNKDKIAISTFRCYVSNIEIYYEDKSVFKEKNSFHLLDLENPNSCIIPMKNKNNKIISKVSFNIGIDSLTNTSGALTGDLDPTKGMYWAWQSGYINMKMEGKSPSCNPEASGRKKEFQFHIGGYLQPYYAMRKKVIAVNHHGDVNIVIDASIFFGEIELSKTSSVMIPGKTAMELSDTMVKMFYLE
jgi:hypothetical protein